MGMASQNPAYPALYEYIYVLCHYNLNALADLLLNNTDSEALVAPVMVLDNTRSSTVAHQILA
jgi:hypothetical protein